MYRNHVGRWRPVHNEVGPFLADTIFAALHLIRPEGEGVRFAADSLVEGDGFELPVPEREDRVSSLGLSLARDRGVGADVSVQPGFVIIMPSPLEASGAALLFSRGP